MKATQLPHPEISHEATDRRLTVCGDRGCACAEMQAKAEAEGFVYVWAWSLTGGFYTKASVPA